jgi:hypothetical protein
MSITFPVCDAVKSACPALNQWGRLKNLRGNSRKAPRPRLGVIGYLKHLCQESMCGSLDYRRRCSGPGHLKGLVCHKKTPSSLPAWGFS